MKKTLGTLSESICRDAANSVLEELQVKSPDEIDLETLAWIGGRKLHIKEGGLENSEGRLYAHETGGVIRIRNGITSVGRRRFTIAHEIGHRVLHGPGNYDDTLKDLRTWSKGSVETEANIFANELLMPEKLFRPLASENAPSLQFIDRLAETFRTSAQATALRFVQITREPCALVISQDNMILWSTISSGFEFRLRQGTLHEYTSAAEIWAGQTSGTRGMQNTPAGAWIEGIDPLGKQCIKEDSRKAGSYNQVISLLWVDDILDE